jgi:alpha-glucosidase
MRPLVYEFQQDEKVFDESFNFMFGRDLLVSNVVEKGASSKEVYLPEGSRWYDWNDNYASYEGGQSITIPVGIETIPMFVREGAIIPMAKNQLLSMEKDVVTKMHLILAPGMDREMTLYDDDGVTNGFEKGVFRKTHVKMEGSDVVKVDFRSEGSYRDTVEEYSIEMIRKDRSPYWVSLGEKELPHYFSRRKFEEAEEGWYYSQTKRAVQIKYPNPGRDVTLTVSFEDFDLIGM